MADRSISDDDICSSCRYCTYNPGDRSSCEKGWPGEVDADGYVVSCDFTSHPDDLEPTPGVIIAVDDDCPSVYIRDSQGEVVMWNYDEIVEDPEAWTASLHAVALASSVGPHAVRAFLKERDRDKRDRIVALLAERRPLWDQFQAQGGRGVELADDIDRIDAELERLGYDA